MEYVNWPKVIDLSHSTTLLGEVRTNNAAVEDLRIPNNAKIYIMDLPGIQTRHPQVNEVINDLDHQVATSPPHGSDFYFYANDYDTALNIWRYPLEIQ